MYMVPRGDINKFLREAAADQAYFNTHGDLKIDQLNINKNTHGDKPVTAAPIPRAGSPMDWQPQSPSGAPSGEGGEGGEAGGEEEQQPPRRRERALKPIPSPRETPMARRTRWGRRQQHDVEEGGFGEALENIQEEQQEIQEQQQQLRGQQEQLEAQQQQLQQQQQQQIAAHNEERTDIAGVGREDDTIVPAPPENQTVQTERQTIPPPFSEPPPLTDVRPRQEDPNAIQTVADVHAPQERGAAALSPQEVLSPRSISDFSAVIDRASASTPNMSGLQHRRRTAAVADISRVLDNLHQRSQLGVDNISIKERLQQAQNEAKRVLRERKERKYYNK